MNVTIKTPAKVELNGSDMFTCQSTGQPAPMMHWAIIDRSETMASVGSGSQLIVGQLCLHNHSTWQDFGRSDGNPRSPPVTLRCTATRLNYTAYSDVHVRVRLSDQQVDEVACGWPMCYVK